jgi:hypothetical protein
MVIPNIDHEHRLYGLPLRRSFGGPSARAARRIAGESGRCDELLELDGQRFLVVAGYRRGEADVMQKAVAVIEAEQQRADHGFASLYRKPPTTSAPTRRCEATGRDWAKRATSAKRVMAT